MGVIMSAVTHEGTFKKRKTGSKRRRKGAAALKALRKALARRKLEEMRDEELLKEQIYDVFTDE
jgi:hypothetical protein